ncbi:hypothetical protein IFM89_009962 [Coptis chinensis]|uniref:Uncharacterized protein n=1 Tax=Coptis chinensis TaxID=261450 RepID=A0A835HM24_9MAGN|nr:hypothetical protein IFM89_009962 [Coptis chinensis]
MGKKHQSESSENSSSDEVKKVKNGVSEYEKKRIERIKENKARLEALRLPSLATSLMGSVEKKNRKGKEKKGEEDDEEYKPSDGEEKASSSSEELVEEDDDDEWINESSYSSRISGCKDTWRERTRFDQGRPRLTGWLLLSPMKSITVEGRDTRIHWIWMKEQPYYRSEIFPEKKDPALARDEQAAASMEKAGEVNCSVGMELLEREKDPGVMKLGQGKQIRTSAIWGKSKTSLNKSTRKKKNPVQKRVEEVEYVDDDEALKKAIALSLGGSLEISCPLPRGPPQNCRVNFQLEERKEGNLVQENDKRKKRRKSSTSCVQMTKDQVIVHFFQFDDMQRVTPMGIGKQKFQCKYCGDIMGGGGMTSLKEHLAGSSSIITACEVPLHIREEMGKQIPERASSPARVTLEQQALQPQVVWPQEEEEDFELKLQQDIEEAMRRSMKDPDYQEMEEIKIAMMESQRLSSQYLERASSSQTPQMTVMAQDSDEELDRMLGLCDDDNDM